jgi:uncharacterized membrane protein
VSETLVRRFAGVAALAGAAIAAYLVYVRTTGSPIACTTGGCETVQQSQYSELLGVPVALLGLAAYLAIFGTCLARGELARAAGAALALSGTAFGAWLLYVQLARIHAVCEWCLASDTAMTAVAILALLRIAVAEKY